MGASSTPFDRFDKLTAGKLRTSRSRKINHPTPSGGMILEGKLKHLIRGVGCLALVLIYKFMAKK